MYLKLYWHVLENDVTGVIQQDVSTSKNILEKFCQTARRFWGSSNSDVLGCTEIKIMSVKKYLKKSYSLSFNSYNSFNLLLIFGYKFVNF